MASYAGPIVDVDIHHRPRNNAELIPYLDQPWRDFAWRWAGYVDQRNGFNSFPLYPPRKSAASPISTHNFGRISSAFPDDGSIAGSSYEILKEQILDKYDYYRAIICHDVGEYGVHTNSQFSDELCRAANRWNVETWLTIDDDRLHSEIVVPAAQPADGAAEIRRYADHPKMSGALLAGNASGKPLGDTRFDPIFKAAVESGLPLCVHPWPGDLPTNQNIHVGGNVASIEGRTLWGQQVLHYISSFIVNGTFEKFPDLTVVIKEYGVVWLPFLIWKLDERYKELRLESPWVKRWPSEYIHDHIRISTQPIEEASHDVRATQEFMSLVDGMEDILCFSTDFPHHTIDYPDYVAKLLPRPWARKVLCDNACEAYGFPVPDDTGPQGLRTEAAVHG